MRHAAERRAHVLRLQQRLLACGHNPGKPDGVYGWMTRKAVTSFQMAEGLTPDGVAGTVTLVRLAQVAARRLGDDARRVELAVDVVEDVFQDARGEDVRRYWPVVSACLDEVGLVSLAWRAMAVATVRAETAGFLPVSEGKSRYNTQLKPGDLYDWRTDLGNQGPPDGWDFRGRGFVQLTGRANYTKFARVLGVDLVGNPELANEPRTAGRLLAAFFVTREARIEGALASGDLREARRAVNGGSHGLVRFVAAYERVQEVMKAA